MNRAVFALVVAVPATLIGTVRADLIVRHPPPSSPGSGPASDTLLADPFGNPSWQQLADDFTLSGAASVSRLTWLGFYGGTFGGSPNPPAGDETMRVRFYAARPSDGLPDGTNVVYEESFLNASRVWTGRAVGLQREYLYTADLSVSVPLAASTTYWFEAVQVGDVSSEFRWEYSLADRNGIAFLNQSASDWRHTTATSDLAFELWGVPEPSTLALLLGAAAMQCMRRPRGRR